MKKMFELAIIHYENKESYNNSDNFINKIFEYKTLNECLDDLKSILENAEYLKGDTIELSILHQCKTGENENTYTFCEINVDEYLRGNTTKLKKIIKES